VRKVVGVIPAGRQSAQIRKRGWQRRSIVQPTLNGPLSGKNHPNQNLCTSEQHTVSYLRIMWPIGRMRRIDHAFSSSFIHMIVVGVILWIINRFIPMASSIKSILNAVVVICVVVWLLNAFGFLHNLSRLRVG